MRSTEILETRNSSYLFRALYFFIIVIFSVTCIKAQCPSNLNSNYNNLSYWSYYLQTYNGATIANTTNASYNVPPAGVTSVDKLLEQGSATEYAIKIFANTGASQSTDAVASAIKTVPNINGYQYDYSFKLGNTVTGQKVRKMVYNIAVPAGVTAYTITYAYALVLQDPSHAWDQQPRFTATVRDPSKSVGLDTIKCASVSYFVPSAAADKTSQNFVQTTSNSGIYYKDWSEASVDLSGYAGKNIVLEFESDDCSQGGHYGYAYFALRNDGCAAGSIAGSNVICNSGTFLYSTPPVVGASYTWTYPSGWTGSSTTNAITLTPNNNSGYITVTPSKSCGSVLTRSLQVTSTPSAPAAPGVITGPTSLCNNSSNLTYTIDPVANASSYVWTIPSGWTVVNGGTSTSIVVTANTSGGTISVAAKNGCGTSSASTSTLSVVNSASSVGGTAAGGISVCAGTSVSLTSSGSTGTIQSWQKSADGLSWSDIASSGTSGLTVSSPTESALYRIKVQNGICPVAYSANTTLTVNALPSISYQPSNVGICASGSASFTVTAIGAGVTYQWQRYNGTSWTNITAASTPNDAVTYGGFTSAILTLTSAPVGVNGYQYRCVVSGTCTPAVTSNAATITVSNAAASISTHPSNVTLCQGSQASLSIAAVGTNLTYQWYSNVTNSNSGGTLIAGETQNSYSFSAATAGVKYYYCVASSTCSGTVVTASSNTAAVTVNTANTVAVSFSTSPATTICAGSLATFTATPTNGGTSPSYTWTKNNITVGTNSATYTNNSLSNNDIIGLTLNSNVSCAIGNPASASPVTITVNPLPAVPANTGLTNVCAGSTITLSNSQTGGIWSSSNASLATVSNLGVVTGIAAGSVLINYTYNNGTCSNTSSTSVTINSLPTISLGTISSVNTNANSFNIPYSASTADKYSISVGAPTSMTGFTAVNLASFVVSPITVAIPASATNTYNFNLILNNSTTGCSSSSIPFTLTVISAASTITATGTSSYTYNGSVQGPVTSNVSGSAGAVSYSYSGTGSTTYGPSSTLPSAAGTYQVIASVASDANYNAASSIAYSFSIAQKSITVTAASKTKVYGSTDPSLTYTVSESLGSDVLSGSLSRAAGENVGDYAINSTLANANYNITYVGANLSITQKGITVTASSKTKVYGATDPLLTYTVSESLGSDVLSGSLSRATGESVGDYAISSTLANANYNITFTPANLSITQKSITVTAATKSKVYGSTDPSLTYTVSESIGSDVLSGSLSRAAGETVGDYAISSTLANANYNITFVPANLSITQKSITVTAVAKSKVYGSTDPELTYTAIGLDNGDVLTGNLSRVAGEIAGEYAINSTLSNAKYSITFVPANLSITQKGITVTAASKTKVYGASDPSLTYTVSESLGSDVLSGSLSRSTGESVGDYAISSTLSNANYNIQFAGASLTITKKLLTVTGITGNSKTYDGNKVASITGTASLNGIVNNDDVRLTENVTYNFGDASIDNNKAITISGLTLTGNEAQNYELVLPSLSANITGNLTITGNAFVCAGFSSQLSGFGVAAASNAWTSSDNSIATVNQNGLVSGIKAGKVTVTYFDVSNVSRTIEFVVNEIPNDPIVSNLSYCTSNNANALTAIATGQNTLTWYSSASNNALGSVTAPIPSTTNAGSMNYYVSQTDANTGCESPKAIITVNTISSPIITSEITGACSIVKGTSQQYTIASTKSATKYVWTLPDGTEGNSNTNTIDFVGGNVNGNLSVVTYNGECVSNKVDFKVVVVDPEKVLLTADRSVLPGNNTIAANITMTLIDVEGNRVNCGNNDAQFFATEGTLDANTNLQDGTYKTSIKATANEVIVSANIAGIKIKKTLTLTYTGPQGGIKSNGAILITEAPKLIFNAISGVEPFTIVLRSENENKLDTATNVFSGKAFAMPFITSSNLYKLVSVSSANGEVRNNNFTIDTATVLLLQPKVIVTLKADQPVLQSDSSYSTRLVLKTENIGEIDLFHTQTKLNLSDVFPSPVTYVLDSVRIDGVTITPNKNYDGITNTDLLARVERQRPASISTNATIDASVMALNATPNGTEIPVEVSVAANAQEWYETFELIDNGHSTHLFGAQSYLPVGAEANALIWVHIKPNGYNKPFEMQAVATGTGTTPSGATALTSSLSNDNSSIAAHPEVTKQGEPLPTILNIAPENPQIGVALNAGTPDVQKDGSFNIPLTYNLTNYGNTNLYHVSLNQNLASVFVSPATYKLVSVISATNTLIPNQNFDGNQTANLLAATSMLGYQQTASVTVTINVSLNQLNAIYSLQSSANADAGTTVYTTNDLSTAGLNPDPDGNGAPLEKSATIVAINKILDPLIAGTVGILNANNQTTVNSGYCVTATNLSIVPTSLNKGGYQSYQYQWQTSTDNNFYSDITGATDSVYTTGSITNSLYLRRMVSSAGQIKYSNPVKIEIYNVVKPVITCQSNLTLPFNGKLTLNATVAASYIWSNNDTARTASVAIAGKYAVTTIDINGCTATSDTTIVKPALPNTTNATYVVRSLSNPLDICGLVKGTTAASFTYYSSATNTTVIPAPSLPKQVGVYTYWVSETVNGIQSDRNSLTVTMINPEDIATLNKVSRKAAVLQSDGSFMVGFNFTINNLRSERLDSISVVDDLSNVFTGSVHYKVISLKASGKLVANSLFDGNTIREMLQPESVLEGNTSDSIELMLQVFPNGFVGTLNNTATITSKSIFGIFSELSNDPTVGTNSLLHVPTKFTIPGVDIFIPSGFSPNRDGINDVFVISRPANTIINLEVFNRWGNLVFKEKDYKNTWNAKGNQPGTILGEDIVDGTYYYVVQAVNLADGSTRQFVGYITIKR